MPMSRRTFVKKTVTTTATLSVAPSALAGAKQPARCAIDGSGCCSAGTSPKNSQNNPRSNKNKTLLANTKIFKSAQLTPDVVNAGDTAEFITTLTVGTEYTPGTSRIIFDFPGTLGQSRPSLTHHEDYGYVEVYISNPDVTYTKRIWDMEILDFPTEKKGSWRRTAQRLFVLDISEGLKPGDIIKVHWGDNQRAFAPGTNVTCAVPKPDHEKTIHVRYFDSPDKGLPDLGRSFKGYDRPVPNLEIPLAFKVLPREPHHLYLIRKQDKALLAPNDRFWNISPVEDASSIVKSKTKPVKNELGVFEYADKNINVISKKLPLYDTPNMDNVFEGMNVYWGNMHCHSAFSVDTIERQKMTMTPADLMNIARNRAGLDFFAVTDHHQPWDEERHKIGKQNWEKTIQAVQQHNKPGQFLTFPGFEFRCPRGDTVLNFGYLPKYEEIDRPDWKDIQDVWNALKGKNYITIPHFHMRSKLELNQWPHNDDYNVEPVIEIFSCHGSYEREDVLENGRASIKWFRPDRCAEFFVSKGYRYGLVCNSDCHSGHAGINGLTAVFAKSLDRESIFQAYRNRNVYGTTNARIRLVFTANNSLMGSVIPNATEKVFMVDVTGESNIKKIDLFKNATPYKQFVPKGKTFKTELAVKDAEPSNWYVRVTQLDNHIAYSSPVWFE